MARSMRDNRQKNTAAGRYVCLGFQDEPSTIDAAPHPVDRCRATLRSKKFQLRDFNQDCPVHRFVAGCGQPLSP